MRPNAQHTAFTRTGPNFDIMTENGLSAIARRPGGIKFDEI